MLASPFSRAELAQSLVPGYDWATRFQIGAALIEWFLQNRADPRKKYSNYELTEGILRNLGEDAPRTAPEFKALSAFITSAGKRKELKPYVSHGPERPTYVKGVSTMVRTRVWSKAKPETTLEAAPLPRPTGVKEDAISLLKALGYTVLAPGEANTVDNSLFTSHPIPGKAPLMCGHCVGTGKVWRKEEA